MPEGSVSTDRRGLKILWAGGTLMILVLSLLPRDMMLAEPPFSDKLAHFLAYAAVIWVGALAASTTKRRVYLGLAMVALGFLLEFAQAYVPGRAPDLLDGLANAFGVISGLGLVAYRHRL